MSRFVKVKRKDDERAAVKPSSEAMHPRGKGPAVAADSSDEEVRRKGPAVDHSGAADSSDEERARVLTIEEGVASRFVKVYHSGATDSSEEEDAQQAAPAAGPAVCTALMLETRFTFKVRCPLCDVLMEWAQWSPPGSSGCCATIRCNGTDCIVAETGRGRNLLPSEGRYSCVRCDKDYCEKCGASVTTGRRRPGADAGPGAAAGNAASIHVGGAAETFRRQQRWDQPVERLPAGFALRVLAHLPRIERSALATVCWEWAEGVANLPADIFGDDGKQRGARICNVDVNACSFHVVCSKPAGPRTRVCGGAVWNDRICVCTVTVISGCRLVINLQTFPCCGIALQSVWKEAAEEFADKPGSAEYRKYRWESGPHRSGVNDLAVVFVVESRDPVGNGQSAGTRT